MSLTERKTRRSDIREKRRNIHKHKKKKRNHDENETTPWLPSWERNGTDPHQIRPDPTVKLTGPTVLPQLQLVLRRRF